MRHRFRETDEIGKQNQTNREQILRIKSIGRQLYCQCEYADKCDDLDRHSARSSKHLLVNFVCQMPSDYSSTCLMSI